jgi:uncharacterized protein YjhX (UPF0386 family)
MESIEDIVNSEGYQAAKVKLNGMSRLQRRNFVKNLKKGGPKRIARAKQMFEELGINWKIKL